MCASFLFTWLNEASQTVSLPSCACPHHQRVPFLIQAIGFTFFFGGAVQERSSAVNQSRISSASLVGARSARILSQIARSGLEQLWKEGGLDVGCKLVFASAAGLRPEVCCSVFFQREGEVDVLGRLLLRTACAHRAEKKSLFRTCVRLCFSWRGILGELFFWHAPDDVRIWAEVWKGSRSHLFSMLAKQKV